MLRFSLLIMLCTSIVLSLFSGLVLVFGATRPPVIVDGFEGCEFPCWYGIPLVEMYSDHQQMIENMLAAGYQHPSMESYDNKTSYFFEATGHCDVQVFIDDLLLSASLLLRHCPDFRLGELMRYTGDPTWIAADASCMAIDYVGQRALVGLQIYDWFSPFTAIEYIYITTGPTAGFVAFKWRGVMPQHFYSQSQVGFAPYTN